MSLYNLSLNGNKLKVGFGDERGNNDAILKEVEAKLEGMKFPGRTALQINGPASLPVAMLIAHKVGHLYQAIACYDPKLNVDDKQYYVVSIAHGNAYLVGDILEDNGD